MILMESNYKATKFQFVVSTPSFNASSKKETRKLVRQHVTRRLTKKTPRSQPITLQEHALGEYLAHRQSSGMVSLPSIKVISQAESWYAAISPCLRLLTFEIKENTAGPAQTSYCPTGSPRMTAALLGGSRPNPFARWLIDMGAIEHEFVHLSKQRH